MISIGILIGFYGYLFPGNINLMVVHLYTSKQHRLLYQMLALIVLFESLYCAAVLYSLQALHMQSQWYHVVEMASYGMLLIMGVWMVLEKKNNSKTTSDNTVYRGLISIVIHPQQIPYWMVAGVLLQATLKFSEGWSHLLPFVCFNAIGTLLVMLFYLLVGGKLILYLKINLLQLNKIMGAVYFFLAIYHFAKVLFK